MNRFFLACLATAGVLSGSTTFADHNSGYSSGSSYHEQLRHNSYERALVHQQGHQYPMTSSQHYRLHNQLNHEASHDAQRHRAYDRVFESPYRSSFKTYPTRDAFGLGRNQGWQGNYAPNYGGTSFGW